MKTDGTVPKEGDETMNQEDLDHSSSDVEMIDETPVQGENEDIIDLSDDDDDGAISPEDDPNEDNDAKIKELEKRLQSELNLRMGHMGFRYGDDDGEDLVDEEELLGLKKKAATKKKTVRQETKASDGKLK
jgi:hypothetical protein